MLKQINDKIHKRLWLEKCTRCQNKITGCRLQNTVYKEICCVEQGEKQTKLAWYTAGTGMRIFILKGLKLGSENAIEGLRVLINMEFAEDNWNLSQKYLSKAGDVKWGCFWDVRTRTQGFLGVSRVHSELEKSKLEEANFL